MKYFIFILIYPCLIFANSIEDENLELHLKSIYNHAKSQKLKYECLIKKNNTHDIDLVYYGKKDAYQEMMKFISGYHHVIDN